MMLASARAWEEALVQMCSGAREGEQGVGARRRANFFKTSHFEQHSRPRSRQRALLGKVLCSARPARLGPAQPKCCGVAAAG